MIPTNKAIQCKLRSGRKEAVKGVGAGDAPAQPKRSCLHLHHRGRLPSSYPFYGRGVTKVGSFGTRRDIPSESRNESTGYASLNVFEKASDRASGRLTLKMRAARVRWDARRTEEARREVETVGRREKEN